SASTLSSPRGLDSDGTRLLVADTLNNRVLAWTAFPTRLGQPADAVLGQPSFSASGVGLFYQAWDARLEAQGAYVATFYTGTHYFSALTTNRAPDHSPIPATPPTRVAADAMLNSSGITRLPSGALAVADPIGAR